MLITSMTMSEVAKRWQPPPLSDTSKKRKDLCDVVRVTWDGAECFQKWTINAIDRYPDRPRRDGFKMIGPKHRLRNEILALQYLDSYPKIPTPSLVFHSIESDHVCLITEAIEGVHIRDLKDNEAFRAACTDVDDIKARMSDIVRHEPTSFIGELFFNEVMCCTLNKRKTSRMHSSDGIYPLCHGDLYASNIIVDPESGRIRALIDWEYAGFFPSILDPPRYLIERKDVGQSALEAYSTGLAAYCSQSREQQGK